MEGRKWTLSITNVELCTIEDKKENVIPARIVFTILGFFGYFNLYAVQISLNIAIFAMVNANNTAKNENVVACPILKSNVSKFYDETLMRRGDFNWDSFTVDRIVESFFYGYFFTQIPGGLLADKYGGKWVYGAGVLITSIFTLLTPMAAKLSPWALVVDRTIVGMAGGLTYPALNSLVAHWAPKTELSRILTTIYIGGHLGAFITSLSTKYLCESSFLGGWPSVFYIWGLMGILWSSFWIFLGYDSPEAHPRIFKYELSYIQKNRNYDFDHHNRRVPWKPILTSKAVWALLIAHVGEKWAFDILLNMTPEYLTNVLYFNLMASGYIAGFMYLIMTVTALSVSFAADSLIGSGYFHTTTARKLSNSIGFFGPGLCAIAIAVIGCKRVLVVIFLCAWFGLNAFIYSGFLVNFIDLSPEFAGTVFGITNTFAIVAGFLAPLVARSILSSGQTLANWDLVFFSCAVVHIVSGLIYVIFASSDQETWNKAVEAEADKPPPRLTLINRLFSIL